MQEPDTLDGVDSVQLVAESDAIVENSASRLIRLDWEHLLRRSRFESTIRKMFPDHRKHERFVLPHVVGYLGRAHGSRPHQIANISAGGFCMRSNELWTPGTEIPITLQREEWDGNESPERLSVQAIVVRSEPRDNGFSEVGFSIVLVAEESAPAVESACSSLWVGRKTMEQFLEELKKPKPPRFVPEIDPSQAPLPLVERTQRLLELARSHRSSVVPERLQARH
ncbi:MAG TPA: PilZ domain-containing protein [Terracidiphilus sp.]|jgi:hypothetical protein